MEKQAISRQRVAKELSAFISQKADDYIPSLELSFWHLPKHLKPCFLYLSAFQEDEEIPVRKLLLLWIAEDFIERREQKSLEDVAEEYLTDLINRSLLQVAKRRSDNGVKACTLHDLILDMCRKIAVEDEGFLFQHQFLISKNRHRLCMDRSLHLANALSTLYNPEKVRIFYSDSVTGSSDVTELGIKIMPDLRCLNILSLKSSISRLQNLEFLVVRHYYAEIPAYLLCMPKLRHLCIGRGSHPARFSTECDNSRINSLQTLFYVDLEDEEILRCSPNLRELQCTSPDNRCPDLSFLPQLESLTMTWRGIFKGDYSVVNFPRNIKKLTLSKFGLPWKKMSLIGTLPNLEILKLQETFEGEIWDTKDDEFQKLKFLQLYRLELKQWNSSHNHFPVLERLVLRDCIDLEEIPSEFSYISTIQEIKVLYCDKKVETSAWEIGREQLDYGNTVFDVTIQSI
ncbi:late blight resistance homolog R1A-10 [Olea europaea subsp. europaea]|uniref:Late blight resistance homolog R1A-10 n=1 Tax=Olea europaea subsp. europaea TaxID=158383 RepID=A0A8S0PB74_OLEEU|nr:late blight resistance homolog R1A-10 [Olea europaea subsp. europaea]